MKLITLLIFLFSSLFLSGKTWFLSPLGSDSNSGTVAAPFFTLNRVWPYIVPGDSVIMRGGIYKYNQEQLLINKSGSYGKPIVIMPYGNEKPVITKGSVTKWVYYSGILVIGDHIVIRGLEVTGWNQETKDHLYYGLIAENCHYMSIEQCSIHDNGFGLVIGDWSTNYSDHIWIVNCDLYNNSDPLTSYGTNTPYGGADGLRIGTQSPTAEIIVSGCRMWNNSDDGVDCFNCNSNIAFYENWAFQNGLQGGNGIGFKLGPATGDYSGQIKRRLINNLAVSNKSIGFDQNLGLFRCELINNSSINNARGYMFNYYPEKLIQHISINNLSIGNTFSSAPVAQFSAQSAIINCSFVNVGWRCIDDSRLSPSMADFTSTDIFQLTWPRLGGKGLPLIYAYHLNGFSKLVEAGYTTDLAFTGQYPEIGAFEYYEN